MSLSPNFSRVALCMLSLLLAACATKNDAYKDSKSLPPLEVPPDLISPAKDASTAIPALPAAAPAVLTTSPPVAPAATTVSSVRLEREGARRWLVVPGEPDAVLSRTQEFLIQERFELAGEPAARGTLETEWRAGGAASGGELDAALAAAQRDKVRVRVEAGRAPGTSELSLSHSGLQKTLTEGGETWQPRAADPVFEATLLDRLQAFLSGEGAAVEPVPDLPEVRANISTAQDGVASLRLDEGFERAWRRIGFALGRAGFVIEDRNRAQGLYHIRLGKAFKEDAKAGFFSRLFGANAGDPEAQYRVHLNDRGDYTLVQAQHPGGAALRTSLGERILEKLKDTIE